MLIKTWLNKAPELPEDIRESKYKTCHKGNPDMHGKLAGHFNVYDLKEAEYEAMRRVIKEVVWPQLRKDIGPTFDEVVQFVESTN